jgi:hypothetical protein
LVGFQEREVGEADQLHELEERHGSGERLSVGDDVGEWYGTDAEAGGAPDGEEVESVFDRFKVRRYRGAVYQCRDFDIFLPGDLL